MWIECLGSIPAFKAWSFQGRLSFVRMQEIGLGFYRVKKMVLWGNPGLSISDGTQNASRPGGFWSHCRAASRLLVGLLLRNVIRGP